MSELSDYFREQGNWRGKKAEQYPEDKRNEQSARALRSLADYIDTGEPNTQTIQVLEAHVPDGGHILGGERAAREVSRYGYGWPVTESTHADFLEELVVLCVEDAYEFAVEHGEDWTETLFEFELAAARDGIDLPPYYFKRRQRWFESESEEAVQAYREERETDESEGVR